MASGLATRCSACATVFRVVPDQLRVSEGWVRCGRCAQVFNALEGLVDLDTGMPARDLGAGLAPAAPAEHEAELEIAHPAARPGGPPLPPQAAAAVAPASTPMSTPTSRDIVADAELHRPQQPDKPRKKLRGRSSSRSETSPAQTPSFVRSADRAAFWRSTPMRASLLLVALLAVLGLAAQVSFEYRDLVAARFPPTRPWLEKACLPLGCTVQAARAIESLAVESSGLVRVEKSNLYKLQVALRNRAGIDLAVPALDLTLTDSQGQLLARKVLRLAELGLPQATIGAGRELNVQATVQAAADGGAPAQAAPAIAGYTIDIFYP